MKLNPSDVKTKEVLQWQGVHLLHYHMSSCSQKVRILMSELVSCLVNSLNYDEPRIVKNKAHSAGNVGTLPRDATPLLAILGHLKGAPHGSCGVVAALGKVPDLSVGPRLTTEPVGRVIIQRINETGH